MQYMNYVEYTWHKHDTDYLHYLWLLHHIQLTCCTCHAH